MGRNGQDKTPLVLSPIKGVEGGTGDGGLTVTTEGHTEEEHTVGGKRTLDTHFLTEKLRSVENSTNGV